MVGTGVCAQQLWKQGSPWSEGKMRDLSQVAFALHLGFTSQLPKVGLIKPLARATLRQRRGGLVLPCLHWSFFIIYFWDTADIWEAPGQSSMVMAYGQCLGKGPFPLLTLVGI